ncbi:hypothetical protein HYPSUDRAFT_204167 [Hypholoma sublateritium FD-334 SS-4]|uniref:Uncharacterized protein n=1 Tax=Hypholoma sublateritium (strain FD-334 SS-4) TaxID=945553 RepID=A0A0D2M995_HYPSF|nr:hypothetical protein HYPSUDRAFT_204167 [Hypholoma sublateritium FD-334 SS-4]
MCRLHTEGTQHGCGHYIITKKLRKDDCDSRFCIFSARHPRADCPSCPHCTRYLGPDASETITLRTAAFCRECEYWFHGPGRR